MPSNILSSIFSVFRRRGQDDVELQDAHGVAPVPGEVSDEEEPVQAPGQLSPALSESHVNMMAFSQCIGIGLLLQAGRVISLAGPGLATFAYVLAGTILWASAVSLGEMSALLPVNGPIILFPMRFLDRSLGFTAGWMAWFSWVVILALELVAITHLFQFHYPEDLLQQAGYPEPSLQFDPPVSPAVFVGSFWVIMLSVNILPVRHLADLEFVFGSIKMAYLCLVCAFNVALHAMRPSQKEAFWTWNSPYSGASQNFTLHNGGVVEGDAGRFLGFWEAVTHALFGLVGFETIAIAAAENKDREKGETVKLATRKISIRIILLYALCTFTAGLNVPYTYPLLRSKEALSIGYGQNSIFTIAPVLGQLTKWPLFFNHFMIFTATTAGIMALYNASRTLHALASIQEVWPDSAIRFRQWLMATNSSKVPKHAVLASSAFGLLGFVAVDRGSSEALARMARACVIGMLITYGIVSASYIQFYKKIDLAAKGEDDTIPKKPDESHRSPYRRTDPQYPFKSRLQPYTAYYAAISCAVIVFFNGWGTLVPPFASGDFFGCYAAVIVMAVTLAFYKIKLSEKPSEWFRLDPRHDLRNPEPRRAKLPRESELRLKYPENWFHRENFVRWCRWLWVTVFRM